MRHIWICIIDGVIIKSGPVQPGDTMPVLTERLMKSYPHMGSDSLKVISEDGRIFDTELPFPSPTPRDPQLPDDVFAAVGVVDGCVGVKIHRGKAPDEILEAELSSFTGKITDDMDFGIFDFSGEQLVTIEEMLAMVSPEQAPDPIHVHNGGNSHHRRARRSPGHSRRGHRHFRKGSLKEESSGGESEETPSSSGGPEQESGHADEPTASEPSVVPPSDPNPSPS